MHSVKYTDSMKYEGVEIETIFRNVDGEKRAYIRTT